MPSFPTFLDLISICPSCPLTPVPRPHVSHDPKWYVLRCICHQVVLPSCPVLQRMPDFLPIEFIIIGGGVAGLTSAIALSRVGHQVTLLEVDPTFKEVRYRTLVSDLTVTTIRILDNPGRRLSYIAQCDQGPVSVGHGETPARLCGQEHRHPLREL